MSNNLFGFTPTVKKKPSKQSVGSLEPDSGLEADPTDYLMSGFKRYSPITPAINDVVEDTVTVDPVTLDTPPVAEKPSLFETAMRNMGGGSEFGLRIDPNTVGSDEILPNLKIPSLTDIKDTAGTVVDTASSALQAAPEVGSALWQGTKEGLPPFLKRAGGGVAQYIAGTPEMADVENAVREGHSPSMAVLRKYFGGPVRDYGKELAEKGIAEQQANLARYEKESPEYYGYLIGQASIQMLPSILASVATKSPTVGLTLMGTGAATQKYDQSIREGRNHEEATQDAMVYGLSEAITERVPLGILTKQGGRYVWRVTKAAGAEAIQEPVNELIQTLYDIGVVKKDMGVDEIIHALKEATIVGGGTGGVLGAVMGIFLNERKLKGSPPPPVEPILPELALDTDTATAEDATVETTAVDDPEAYGFKPTVTGETEPTVEPVAPVVQGVLKQEGDLERTVKTQTGTEVTVMPEVIDAANLIPASDDLQPRDRDRAAMEAQVSEIAANLDPELLQPQPDADRGAPIIGPDNVVESGNGRVLAIQRAFEQHPELADAYKQMLINEGYAEADIEGMEVPILVQRRTTEMTQEERVKFVQDANVATAATFSASEQSVVDADRLDAAAINVLAGADIAAPSNRAFVRQALEQITSSPGELNNLITKSGELSQEGVKRLQGAVLAKAYPGQHEFLARQLESTDDDIRSVSMAFKDVAGEIIKTRNALMVVNREDYEISGDLADAAEMFRTIKEKKISLEDFEKQVDLVGRNETAVALLNGFFNTSTNRAAGREKVAQFIRDYLDSVPIDATADMFGGGKQPKIQLIWNAVTEHEIRNHRTAIDQGDIFVTPKGDVVQTRKSEEPAAPTTPTPAAPKKPDMFTPQPLDRTGRAPLKSGNAAVALLITERGVRKRAGEIHFTLSVPLGDQIITLTHWGDQGKSGKTQFRVDGKVQARKKVEAMQAEGEPTPTAKAKAQPLEQPTKEFPNPEDSRAEDWRAGLLGTPYDDRINNLPENPKKREDAIDELRNEILEDIENLESEWVTIFSTPGDAGSTQVIRKAAALYGADAQLEELYIENAKATGSELGEMIGMLRESGVGKKKTPPQSEREFFIRRDEHQGWTSGYKSIGVGPNAKIEVTKTGEGFEYTDKTFDTMEEAEEFGKIAPPKRVKVTKKKITKKAAARKGTRKRKTADTDRAGGVELAVTGIRTDDVFSRVSWIQRPSQFRDLFRVLGKDPALAENLPIQAQWNLAVRAMKQRMELKFIETDDAAKPRYLVDHLLDLYHGLTQLTAALDLPQRAIGLDNTLGLLMMGKRADYLGVYGHMGLDEMKNLRAVFGTGKAGEPTIGLPQRSNSFAHEWFHALDYHLMEKHGAEVGRGLSAVVRELGDQNAFKEVAPKSVADAFAEVIATMFFDQSQLAQKIMEVESKLARTKPGSKNRTALQQQLRNLQSGKSRQGGDIRSQFWKSARDFAKSDYWIRPTEMFARAGEAYVGYKLRMGAEEFGGTVGEGLSKGDEAYLNDLDKRLRETFPKGEERARIFTAFDRLFEAIRAENVLSRPAEESSSWPDDMDMLNQSTWWRDVPAPQRKTLLDMWNNELKAWKGGVKQHDREQARPKSVPGNMRQRATRAVWDAVGYVVKSERGLFLTWEKRYPDNRAIPLLIQRLFSTPGTGRQQFPGGPFELAMRQRFNRYSARYGNIINKHGLLELDDDGIRTLRRILISQVSTTGTKESTSWYVEDVGADPDVSGIPRNLIEGARDLRVLLNDMWHDVNDAGMLKGNLGYAKSGYLTRNWDAPIITSKPDAFVKDARKLYNLKFTKYDFPEGETTVDDLSLMLRNRAVRQMLAEQGTIEDVQKILKKISTLKQKAALEGKKVEIGEELIQPLYQYTKAAVVEVQAIALYSRIANGPSHSLERQMGFSGVGYGKWTKQRKLPPEADTIMENWYQNNPLEVIADYMVSISNAIEYYKRFKKGNARDKLVNALPPEIRTMGAAIVDFETGRIGNTSAQLPRETRNGLGYAHTIALMARLPRAVLSSVPEHSVLGLITNRMRDSVGIWGPLAKVMFNRQNAHEMKMMGQLMGIIGSPELDQVHIERLGGTFADDPKFSRRLNRFFRATQLIPLTHKQWQAVIPALQLMLHDLAMQYQGKVKDAPMSKEAAADSLRDVGIRNDDLDQFTKWLIQVDGKPTEDDLGSASMSDMADIYSMAMYQLTRLTIQEPTKGDRPYWQRYTFGQFALGITSFSYGFQRNVTIRMIQQTKAEFRRADKYAETGGDKFKAKAKATGKAAKFAGRRVFTALTAYYLGVLLVTILREAAMGGDRWEEEKEKGTLTPWLLELAWNRTGFIGALDPWYNLIRNVRYKRDLSNYTAGPTGTYWLQALERLLFTFFKNSPTTNTAQRNRWIAAYELAVLPAVLLGITALSVGPMLALAFGASAMWMSSGSMRKQVGDWMAGPRKEKGGGSKPWL